MVELRSKQLAVLTLLLVVKALLHFYRPGGLLAYFIPSLCWVLVALAVLWACGLRKLLSYTNKTLTIMALLAALFQIALLVDAGLITKFGKSPVSFTPTAIALNTLMITTSLIGVELSRAYLLRTYGKDRPLLVIILTALLYSPTPAMIAMLIPPIEPLSTVKFLGSTFLTELAKNILASYLALLAGPIASLAYTAPLKTFQWYSPILPDLPWGFESLIGVVAPTISLVAIDYVTPATTLKRAGINVKPKWRSEDSITPVLTVLGIFLTVWFSTGLLGVFPTVVLSGSMRPTIEVGDLLILVKTPVERIKPGDIIQYATLDGMVVHRVVEIRDDGKLITKGDACSTPDPEPVHPLNVRGRLIAIIPKVGWTSIYMKEGIRTLWSLVTMNNLTLYGTVSAATATAVLAFYKTRRGRRWKGRRRWTR
ncbi:signal peptidase I [Candidatus Bathyarchaeota archaeon]|nr:MAG: signal peptidase I [Candidatus Bathyarchaeota archaeon]